MRGRFALLSVAVALAAAVLHVVPYWHASWVTEPGWEFTGNIYSSSDFIQYRVWPRQSALEGALVTNRFTTEPHRPYLPVVFYHFVGIVARWSTLSPEWTHVYLGSVLAFGFVILLIGTVRTFLPNPRQYWCVAGTILCGGGLGAYLRWQRIVKLPASWYLAEDYRGLYVFATLFDTHYLMVWVATTAAVMSYYHAISRPHVARRLLAAGLFALVTLLHVYEAVTLVAIVGGVLYFFWLKGLPMRRALVDGVICAAAAWVVLAILLVLHIRSGLPLPRWTSVPIPFAMLLIAHPVAWGLIVWGISRYWSAARVPEVFLLGWALGCTALTLSGPFYPYPDRGTMTLQIPIYVIAGGVFFRWWTRVTWPAVALAIVLLGATPLWVSRTVWVMGRFATDAPHKWLDAEERGTIEVLARRASKQDVLLSDPNLMQWLAPEYPGRFYVGHFFLTVGFERKHDEWKAFCDDSFDERFEFLRQHQIRFLYLPSDCRPMSLDRRSGLQRLARDRNGELFEFADAGAVSVDR